MSLTLHLTKSTLVIQTMINVYIISNTNNVVAVKYIFTLDYCFNSIYESAYDLVRKMSVPGSRIMLLSHDSIKQIMYFKLL